MVLEVDHLLDPEILIPSDASRSSLEFWSRVLSWSKHSEFKIGPATLLEIGELAKTPPQIQGFPERDFWAVIGKFTARPITRDTRRNVCDVHPGAEYHPHLGDLESRSRLREDLRDCKTTVVALGTDGRSWKGVDPLSCTDCALPTVYKILDSSADLDTSPAWRKAYTTSGAANLHELGTKAHLLFPRLAFSYTCWDRISQLSGESADSVTAVVHHLGTLHDHAARIWKTEPTTVGRQAALKALGVAASPESQTTRKNSKLMRLRDFNFPDGDSRCEWHTKINKTGDRIHFAVTGDQVLIGAIVDHLPT